MSPNSKKKKKKSEKMSFRVSKKITIWSYSIKNDLSNIELLTRENHMNEMSHRSMNLSLVRKKDRKNR